MEDKDSLSAANWTMLKTINAAASGTQTATDTITTQTQRFYRVASP